MRAWVTVDSDCVIGLVKWVPGEVDERKHEKHWSRTQASRALSTAEAKYDAVNRGAAEGLRMQSMMTEIWTDSGAAKAIAERRGLGKTIHAEVKYWWLHEVTKSRRVKMKRVPREQMLPDHLMKGVRQALGNPSAAEILEACLCAKSKSEDEVGTRSKNWRTT